jgi:hypothetical protein
MQNQQGFLWFKASVVLKCSSTGYFCEHQTELKFLAINFAGFELVGIVIVCAFLPKVCEFLYAFLDEF